MTARFPGIVALLLACCMFLFLVNALVAQTQPTEGTAKTLGPKPSVEVAMILKEASRLADAKQPADSLKTADHALDMARQSGDKPGEAFSHQARAKALQDLQRTDDAVAAWQQAAQIWAASDVPEQTTALIQAGLLCLSDRKREAEELFAQALSVAKSENAPSLATAQALYDSGVVIAERGQEQTAIDYLNVALTIREKGAAGSLKVVEALNALAKVEIDSGVKNADDRRLTLGREHSARAADLGQHLAPDSAVVVRSLHNLAYAEDRLSNGAGGNAPEHYFAALEIQKKLVPGGSLDQAEILRDLGNLEDNQANFAVAHQHLQEAVAIGERVAPESPEFEHGLEDLAIVESDEGNLSAAREHLQRALTIKQTLRGNLAPTFINLGALAFEQSDYAAARDYFEKALALFIKVTHKTAGVSFALADLSETLHRQGDLASAFEFRRRALAIDETNWPESSSTANNLNGMGDLLREQGKFSEAADYYQRALELRQKIAPDSFLVSDTLQGLAELARIQHDTNRAVEYERRALEFAQKSCPNAWCTPRFLNDLGELAYEQGDLSSSESYLRRAVDIREQSLGPEHPDLARSLNSLALTVAAQGRTAEALETALRAERIGAEHLRISVRTLSERQALAYEGIRASGLDLAITLAANRAMIPSARQEILDAVVRSRALVFDELAARYRSTSTSEDPEVNQLANQLLSARTRLATLVFRGVGDTKPEVYRKLLDEARDSKEKAERMLAEKSVSFRQDLARTQLGLKEVAASLPQGTALVAFVRYARHDLQKFGRGHAVPKPIPSYGAFVLRAGEQEPEFVRLGVAREVERLLVAWRRAIARPAEATDVPQEMGADSYRRVGAALRRKIWDPVVPELGDARKVFVVPDAALHLVNLVSLPVGVSRYLIETGPLIHYLSTERDLAPAPSRHGEGMLVVGSPAFDQAGKVLVASNQQAAPARAISRARATMLRGSRSACGTFKTLHFPPLPASQREAEDITALWKRSSPREGVVTPRGPAVQPTSGELLQLSDTAASVEAFEQYAPGKRVLHVATHGFFLEGSCESAAQRKLDADNRDEVFLPATAENPLLLSGLAFAGANRRSSSKPGESDGILTAEEIAGINLEGVDWAVLSACNTGVGEIKVGEGVFGLRRAFQVAGAKTVIMSLWPVEDETTRQWMGTLYREHFLNGKDTGDSVRAASLQILRQRRAKHKSTHPFYWGAFIAAGDWH